MLLIPLPCVPSLSAKKSLSSFVKAHNAACIVMCFCSRKAEMMRCSNVPLYVFPSSFHMWLINDYTDLHTTETCRWVQQFLLCIFGKHAGARRNDNALALGQCALQYHSACPRLSRSFKWGSKQAAAKERNI